MENWKIMNEYTNTTERWSFELNIYKCNEETNSECITDNTLFDQVMNKFHISLYIVQQIP